MKVQNRSMFNLGLALLAFSALMLMAGCAAPTFLTDLEEIIPVASSAVAGILTIIGSFSSQPELVVVATAINTMASKAEADLKIVTAFIDQYKANPNDTILQNIEGAINTAMSSLSAVLQVNGVPAQQAQQIAALVNAINMQLEALLTVLPVFNSQTAGQQIAVTKPIGAATFKAQIAAVMNTTVA